MKDDYLTNMISSQKKISEILESRGIQPARRSGNKLIYHCPLHAGDKTPSFFVYQEPDGRENYFCYSCKSGGLVINFYRELLGISYKDAIHSLAGDVDASEEGRFSYSIKKVLQGGEFREELLPLENMELLSRNICAWIEYAHGDPIIVEKLEEVLRIADDMLVRGNVSDLRELIAGLPKRVTPFILHRVKFLKEKGLFHDNWRTGDLSKQLTLPSLSEEEKF